MIPRIIEYCVRNRFIVLMIMAGVAVWGVFCVVKTPIDAIPDLSENQVIVFTDWMGRSPQEIDDQITCPLSVNLQGLAGVKAIRSASEFNFSMINIIFDDKTDFYFARTRVLERLNIASTFLPLGVVPYLAPDALKQIIPTAKLERPLDPPVRPVPARPSHHGRSFLFFVADLVFLVLAGLAATLTMHWAHQLQWPFIPTSVVGMIAAMLVQTLMAFAVAPLLGSIESMVPSMIVAMVSPMTICALHLFGCESTWTIAAAMGIAFALGMFVFIQLYARSCRHAFARQAGRSRG